MSPCGHGAFKPVPRTGGATVPVVQPGGLVRGGCRTRRGPVPARRAARLHTCAHPASHGTGTGGRAVGTLLEARPKSLVPSADGSCEASSRRADESMPLRIGEEAQRRNRPQPPTARRVAAAWARLLRTHSSPMRSGIASSWRLESGPMALATDDARLFGRASRTRFITSSCRRPAATGPDCVATSPRCARHRVGAAPCPSPPRSALGRRRRL